MNRTRRIAAVAALALAVAACGRPAEGNGTVLSDADNMLVPADENAATAAEEAGDAGTGNGGDAIDNAR